MDWITFISSVGFSGLITYGIQSYIKGSITHHYKKKLEHYKEELGKLSDYRKFDFDRKIHDFSLYSNNKHEIYPELNKKLVFLRQRVADLHGYIETNITEESFIIHLDNQKGKSISDDEYNSLIMDFEVDESIAIDKLEIMILSYQMELIAKALDDAHNYYVINELYLSGKINYEAKKLFSKISSLYKYMSLNLRHIKEDFPESELKDYLDCFESFKSDLKNELSISDYENN